MLDECVVLQPRVGTCT